MHKTRTHVRRGSKPPLPADRSTPTVWVWAVCGFLLLAVGVVFAQTLRHQIIGFDDDAFVFDNPHVTPGLTPSGLWWALTDGTFGEWIPLSTLSHMLDCQLYGVKPAGHFLTNVLLHAASSVLLFLVLLRMTRDLWPSAWVAAVFAVHPLHVESVAWVAERKDLLSGLFFMLTLGAYALYAERPSLTRYLAVSGLLALGLMAKPMLVTVPFLLLLLDYWPLDRFRRATGADQQAAGSWFGGLPVAWRLVLEKVPLIILAAVDCVIVMVTHASVKATYTVERLPLATRLANGLVSYATYLGQSFYPVNLAPFYPHLGKSLPIAWAVASLVLLVAITVIVAFYWRRQPYLLVGWLWFLGMLVPVIGLVQIGAYARADRYTYLSQIGLSIAMAWCVWSVYRSRQSFRAEAWRQWALVALSGAAVLALAAVAWQQTSYWRDRETLWTHTIACTKQNMLAHYNFAYPITRQGRITEAMTHLSEALAIGSIDAQLVARCHGLYGDCLASQGKTDEALEHFEEAVRVIPVAPMFHDRLAIALAGQGQFDRAIVEWRETIRLAPDYSPARLGLADALLTQGHSSEAADQCRQVLENEPESINALVILGAALVDEGKVEEALPVLERAVKAEPRNARAQFHLGQALYRAGQSPSALAHLNEALHLQPNHVSTLWLAAWILATDSDASNRDGAQAVMLAKRAVERSGGQEVRAFDALAAALAETDKFPAAVDAADRASAIALTRGDKALADAIDQRRSLYREGLPYREPAPRPTGPAPTPPANVE